MFLLLVFYDMSTDSASLRRDTNDKKSLHLTDNSLEKRTLNSILGAILSVVVVLACVQSSVRARVQERQMTPPPQGGQNIIKVEIVQSIVFECSRCSFSGFSFTQNTVNKLQNLRAEQTSTMIRICLKFTNAVAANSIVPYLVNKSCWKQQSSSNNLGRYRRNHR
jgi:hypothetical protein